MRFSILGTILTMSLFSVAQATSELELGSENIKPTKSCQQSLIEQKKLADEAIERITYFSKNLSDERTRVLYSAYLEDISKEYPRYEADIKSYMKTCVDTDKYTYTANVITQEMLRPKVIQQSVNASVVVDKVSCKKFINYTRTREMMGRDLVTTVSGVRVDSNWNLDLVRFRLDNDNFSWGGSFGPNIKVDTTEGAETIQKLFNSQHPFTLACAKTDGDKPSASYDSSTNTLTALYTSKFGFIFSESFLMGPSGIGMNRALPNVDEFMEAIKK